MTTSVALADSITLLASSAKHGTTFLGEDAIGWRTAFIAAILAAIVYEITMALLRKITLRLPFLILHFARVGMTKGEWQQYQPEWKAELWHTLRDRSVNWFTRYVDALRYALRIAFDGARRTAKVDKEATPRRRILAATDHQRRVVSGIAHGIAGLGGGSVIFIDSVILQWVVVGIGSVTMLVGVVLGWPYLFPWRSVKKSDHRE